MSTTDEAVGFEGVVRTEWDELAKATTAMHNAFGYFDDPTDPAWAEDAWGDAASSAVRVSEAAEDLANAARRIARDYEAKADEMAEKSDKERPDA